MNLLLKAAITTAICFQAWASPALAQGYSQAIPASYRVLPNVTYLKSGVWEGKLDIYSRIDSSAPQPTLVFIHGGGSLGGSKESALCSLLPYLEWGWNVVNVEHRLAGVTLAPAALQNCLCALRWVTDHAREYGVDPTKLVVSGTSSGGWFAVAAGLGVRPNGWEEACPGAEDPKVSAIVNWYGNWDLADVLEGPNAKPYAPEWVRNLPNPLDVAQFVAVAASSVRTTWRYFDSWRCRSHRPVHAIYSTSSSAENCGSARGNDHDPQWKTRWIFA